jgi:hypothetical protein
MYSKFKGGCEYNTASRWVKEEKETGKTESIIEMPYERGEEKVLLKCQERGTEDG